MLEDDDDDDGLREKDDIPFFMKKPSVVFVYHDHVIYEEDDMELKPRL